MSTIADLPTSSRLLTNPNGNGPITGEWTAGLTGGFTEVASWSVPIEDFPAFLTAVGGKTQVFGTGTGSTITRIIPLQSPHFSFLYANTLTYKLLGADPNVNTSTRPCTHAIATITFRTPTYDTSGSNAYQTIQIGAATEFITVPGTNYVFGSGERNTSNVGIQIGTLAIGVTLHQIPSLDVAYSILAPVFGLVNSSVLTIGSTSFAAGTVLFNNFSSVRSNMINGQISQELTYSLVYRSLGWNNGIRSDGVADSLTPAPYTGGNLSVLFY